MTKQELFEEMAKQSDIKNYYTATEEARKQLPPGTVATVNGRPITTQGLTDECLSRYGQEVLEGEISRKVLTQELGKKKLQISQQYFDIIIVDYIFFYIILPYK